jgi:hypothetical protein
MKNIVLIIALALSIVGVSAAQTALPYGYPYATVSTTDTLGTNVTAYAAGQMIRGGTAYKIMLVTPRPMKSKASLGCWINTVKIEMDSVCPGSFIVYALKDTAGLMLGLTADHAAAQYKFGSKSLGFFRVSTEALGTTAGGALQTFGQKQWFFDANFDSYTQDRIYWLVIADGAWTPKKNGVIKIAATMESK